MVTRSVYQPAVNRRVHVPSKKLPSEKSSTNKRRQGDVPRATTTCRRIGTAGRDRVRGPAGGDARWRDGHKAPLSGPLIPARLHRKQRLDSGAWDQGHELLGGAATSSARCAGGKCGRGNHTTKALAHSVYPVAEGGRQPRDAARLWPKVTAACSSDTSPPAVPARTAWRTEAQARARHEGRPTRSVTRKPVRG